MCYSEFSVIIACAVLKFCCYGLIAVYFCLLQVNVPSLTPDHAYIQITHVEPYFTVEELEERKTKFERENNISQFVFETPFTVGGKTKGDDVTKQCMRKTILTSEVLGG